MHTLAKAATSEDDYVIDTDPRAIGLVNELISRKAGIEELKANLPEGFFQSREVVLSLKEMKHIISQRHNHRLPAWRTFCKEILDQTMYPQYFDYYED